MKTFRFLKPEWKALIVVFFLLVAQVSAELALPAYTSSLVNVGIQQDGIENALAATLREGSMKDLFLLMEDADKEAVLSAYDAPENGLYHLKTTLTGEQREAAIQALNLPMGMLFGMQAMPGGEVALAGLRSGLVTRETLLAQLEAQTPLTGEVGRQFVAQAAAQYVRAEYQAQGINIDAVRNRYLWTQGLYMLGLTLLSGVAALTTSFLSSRASARIGRGLRSRVFKKVLFFSKAEVDRFSTASLITRTTNDINQIQQVSVMMMRMLFYAPIMALGGIYRVTQVKTGLGWIVVVTVAAMVLMVVTVAAIVTPKFRKSQELLDRMNLVARENLTGVQVVRAFSREETELARFGEANSNLTELNRKINYTFGYIMPLMMLLLNVVSLAIIWFGAQGVDLGRLQVGDMIAFMSYTFQIAFAFMTIAMMSSVMLPRAEVASQRVHEVLATDNSIKDQGSPGVQLPQGPASLRFDRVSFRYPDSKTDVLHEISFDIKAGQTAAVIGATGSGKSSLVQLIPRFFDVSQGQIEMDGVNIKDLPLATLRAQIGFVPQTAQLFSGTITSNIAFADEGMTEAEILKAAELAQAARFIEEREEGMDSAVAQGGSNLSGGQKQRLSIARALAAKPRLLLFDDSFSALDYRTDLMVRQALKTNLQDTTVLIVAQRIATVMQADTILVLEEGRLVGQGSHRELIKTCATYQQIARSQLSDSELAGTGGAAS